MKKSYEELEKENAELKRQLEERRKEIPLNDIELYCLAWHYNIFFEQSKLKQIADYALPCSSCKHNKNCYAETKQPVVYVMEQKLPVQIFHAKHKKDIFSFGQKQIDK